MCQAGSGHCGVDTLRLTLQKGHTGVPGRRHWKGQDKGREAESPFLSASWELSHLQLASELIPISGSNLDWEPIEDWSPFVPSRPPQAGPGVLEVTGGK